MNGMAQSAPRQTRYELIILAGITLVAVILRFYGLESVPPGWRDDELINSLVISQKVLDGDLALYYPDASGHEALYHALNALMLGLFGPSVAGIRWLSAVLGTLAVPLTYLVGRRLFGSWTGLVAAAALAFSFWSLMYSRIGLRHILTTVLVLATFYFFLRGLNLGESSHRSDRSHLLDFILAGTFMGLGFYTYFAGRGVPLILIAFCIFAFLFARQLIIKRWRGLLLMFGLGLLLAVPLLVTLAQQPESEARVAELAVPIVEARVGNFDPLLRHLDITLSMFHADGDDEWLYNIPHRPVFGPLGAAFFWAGVLIALGYTLPPLVRWLFRNRRLGEDFNSHSTLSAAFLLLWWLAGISPGFISVPPASLGHTIMAQPAVFILAALPLWWLANHWFRERKIVPVTLGLLLIATIALRDLPAYFVEWPQRGMTRFLYRADIHEVASYLNKNPELEDFGITGLLAGPWDRVALAIDLDDKRAPAAAPRWYNPERALLLVPSIGFGGFPTVQSPFADSLQFTAGEDGIGGYHLYQVADGRLPSNQELVDPVCFTNGLCWAAAVYDVAPQRLELEWFVREPLDLPPMPLISNPPPPGVYSGSRLSVFAHLQDSEGRLIVGDDGLWVDPITLQPGDRFVQQHWLAALEGAVGKAAVFGLYDPYTGERILTLDGRDHIRLEIGE
jgi:4-amino-4-deoxy-L-arabinose transferase-like glycosyltransferase